MIRRYESVGHVLSRIQIVRDFDRLKVSSDNTSTLFKDKIVIDNLSPKRSLVVGIFF